MDEARHVLERLDRIEELGRARAAPARLLPELRALVREAEAWARREGAAADRAGPAIDTLRVAVEGAGPRPGGGEGAQVRGPPVRERAGAEAEAVPDGAESAARAIAVPSED